MTIFSTPDALGRIGGILCSYLRLPFSEDTIPGSIMEAVLAHVHDGEALKTYDFVDVVNLEQQRGWQVKSTKENTPVTWKRAKIPDKQELISASHGSERGLQELGDAIIDFCNSHVVESLEKYSLSEIGYARLIVHKDGNVTYFERLLCTRADPMLFNPSDFSWRWSNPKRTIKKEQLPALHGIHNKTGKKWWAWHGLSENQLHFTGEKTWWPSNEDCPHSFRFRLPGQSEKLSLEEFIAKLELFGESS